MPAPKRRDMKEGNWVSHENCWAKTLPGGKPGISVRDHSLNVGCVAEALLELLPAQLCSLLRPGAATLAALHDVGKVSPGFQSKSPKWLEQHGLTERALREGWSLRESDHAKISQFTLQGLFGQSRLYVWAAIVGAHHGRIKGERVPPLREHWEEERRRLSAELIQEFGPLPDQRPDEATLWFVGGLITSADWIGSNESHFPQDACWDMAERRERARDALKAIGWTRAKLAKGLAFRDLFPSIAWANSLQVQASQAVRHPGVYIVEGPMGYGKTEAALVAAYQLLQGEKATGLYFALPTQVTSNRIHLRVQPFLEQIVTGTVHARLAHSASWLMDPNPPPRLLPASPDADALAHVRAGRSWFASPKRALLAPYGVGTIDQALLGIVAANHFFVRQFGLAGKVVVLDEVHSYDLYTSTLIDTLIARLRELQCTVIVLSATLTRERRCQLLRLGESTELAETYPLLSAVTAGGEFIQVPVEPPPPKTVAVSFAPGDEFVEQSLQRARQGQCVLWIRNTVDEAQDTYCRLKTANHEGGPPIGLLHSRFPYFRREELESRWLEALGKDASRRPPNGCVLVSTQVAEQSVDIDADLLITDLAPTDMLLQRLGRLWRHERPNRTGQPEVWIHEPGLSLRELGSASPERVKEALGKSAKVYAPYVLLRSLQQWRGREGITLPADIRPILEATYAPPPADEPKAWRTLSQQVEAVKDRLRHEAERATRIWVEPSVADREEVQTRYSAYPTAALLIAGEISPLDANAVQMSLLNSDTATARLREWNLETAKAIHRNLARVPYWAVRAAVANAPAWLAAYVYQPTAVGLFQQSGAIRWSRDETGSGLFYCADRGIIIDREAVRPRTEEEDEPYG
ncbi:MAG: CRISPR-associated helicase Cas3' [bacterium]